MASRIRITSLLAIAGALGAVYLAHVRRWMRDWGATESDVRAWQPGDDVVEQPAYCTTHAVTISAPPAAIWPWLVQMGYRRGGLYSYDWLDRAFGFLDRPSADTILPEFQNLKAGDVIPLGSGPDWPVHTIEPQRALVLAPEVPDFTISWAFILREIDATTTRLISRVRASTSAGPQRMFMMHALMEPVAFAMERRMLLGIKERAEQMRAAA